MTDTILRMIEAVHGAALKAADLGRRDRREPGRREKERAELRLLLIVRRVFREQAARLRGLLEAEYPERKAIAPPRKPPVIPADFLSWDEEDQWDFIAVLEGSGRHGAALFAEQVMAGIDYTAVNQRAARAARERAGDMIREINTATRDAVRQAIKDFAATPGMTIGDVIDRLPFDERRAQTIAVTEITAAYAAGEQAAGQELRQKYPDVPVVKTWFTNNDDLVCPVCGPLNGMAIPFESAFPGEDAFRDALLAPPAHPNCRCWLQSRTDIRSANADSSD